MLQSGLAGEKRDLSEPTIVASDLHLVVDADKLSPLVLFVPFFRTRGVVQNAFRVATSLERLKSLLYDDWKKQE